MSAILGSPLGRLLFVRSEAASEGLPLMVEKRFEFRFCGSVRLEECENPGEGKSYRVSHDGTLRIKRSLTGHFVIGDVV